MVTDPLMMSPVPKSGSRRSPVSASRKWTLRLKAPTTTQVRPSRSKTAGWPVQPVPHHWRGSPPIDDSEHIGSPPGNRQATSGAKGTGPLP